MMKFEDYKQYLSPVFAKQTDLIAKSASGSILPISMAKNTWISYRASL